MYSYRVLDESRNEIRLLILLPGAPGDEVYCGLRHAEISVALEFTALSYTWGDQKHTKTISIDGDQFEVTNNLFDALQYMRHTEELRTLWIDAVCINQDDLEERSKQVLRMRDIYTMAAKVEVWLGRIQDENDELAIDLVRRLGAIVENSEEALAQGFSAQYQDRFIEEFGACTPQVLRGLSYFFKRPWWTRVWVVQELALAKQPMAVVRCGWKTVAWLDFLIAAYAIEHSFFIVEAIISREYSDERLDAWNQGIRMAQCRKVEVAHPAFTLLELLNQHRDCEATDPRDKIFGLLGLSGDVDSIGIQPKYGDSLENVYTDLFKKHVISKQSLDMICAVRYPRNLTHCPSWVPDWSTDQLVPGLCINDRYLGGNSFPGSPISHFQKYAAAGTSSPHVSFSDDKMSVRIIVVGKIISLGVVDKGMSFEEIETFGRADENGKSGSDSQTFNQWLNMVLDSDIWIQIAETYGSEDVLDAFCRTLVGNRNNRMMKPPNISDEGVEDDSDYEDDAHEMEYSSSESEELEDVEIEDAAPALEPDENLFSPPEMLSMTLDGFRACLQVSWGKCLAILHSGHIGIVPGHSLVGDMVVVALGCTMPLVLRPAGEQKITVVGESYIHGVMDGELIGRATETLILE